VFRRAYSACPDAGDYPLLTAVYPHAYGARPPESLTRFFEVVTRPDARTIVVSAGAGLHIPLAIRYPGVLTSGANDMLISTVDVLPTVMGLAGLALPERIHGRDFSPSLTRGAERPAAVFSEGDLGRPLEWRMVVRGFDKLVTNLKLEPLHLFNLTLDPDEQDDLVRSPEQRLKIDELRALLRDWQKRTGDGMDASGLRRR
jgi:arylsulfatase A-like enzyme